MHTLGVARFRLLTRRMPTSHHRATVNMIGGHTSSPTCSRGPGSHDGETSTATELDVREPSSLAIGLHTVQYSSIVSVEHGRRGAQHSTRKRSTFAYSGGIPIAAKVIASGGSPRVQLTLDLQSALGRQHRE